MPLCLQHDLYSGDRVTKNRDRGIYCFPNILVRSTTIRDYIVSYLKEQVLVYQNQLSDGWTNSLNRAFSENSSLTTNGKRNALDQLSPKCNRSFALSFLEFSYTHVTIQHEVSSVYFYRVDRSNILPSLRAWNCAQYSRYSDKIFHLGDQILKVSRQIGDYNVSS